MMMKEYKEYAVYVDGVYIGRFDYDFECVSEIHKYLDENDMPCYTPWAVEFRTGRVFEF